MSVQSEARYYRQGPPPTVTGDQILEWIKQVRTIGIIDPGSGVTLDIDYGKRIDKRHKTDKQFQVVSPSWWKRVFGFRKNYATLSKSITHEHDLEIEAESFEMLFEQFKGGGRSIQRAHITFESMNEGLERRLTAPESDENPRAFRPFYIGLTVAPVELFSLGWDNFYTVGYISMDIFGDGHFWPETFGQWVTRCADEPMIQAACDICKHVWPIDTGPPDDHLLAIRKDVEHFWPYADPSGPNDWAWGMAEDG
tara:strand:- start:722 stop:1480 length:759 start_codon:yes stop_codon:yes gene_type:complete